MQSHFRQVGTVVLVTRILVEMKLSRASSPIFCKFRRSCACSGVACLSLRRPEVSMLLLSIASSVFASFFLSLLVGECENSCVGFSHSGNSCFLRFSISTCCPPGAQRGTRDKLHRRHHCTGLRFSQSIHSIKLR